jgi:hypothetical protein
MASTRVVRYGWSVVGAVAAVLLLSATADAQVAVTGGLDFTNQYNFRGIRQNSDGVSIWPYVDFGGTLLKGDGAVKAVTANAGLWNAINSQINEDDFGTGNKWYELDYYATLGLGFGGGVTLGTTYTSYTSPADLFAHVKELAFKLSVDDSASLGKASLKPYGLVAFELDENGADGVADDNKGVYVELGIAPGYAGKKASVAVPIKVGLSAKDYYYFPGLGYTDDGKFGYFSIAGIVTVPVAAHLNVHGGVEVQVFGDRLKEVNGFGDDHDSKATGLYSIGLGFSF